MDEDIEKLNDKTEEPRTEKVIREVIEMCVKCLKKVPEVKENDGMQADILEQMFTTTLANEQNELIKLLDADIAELNAKLLAEQTNALEIEERTDKIMAEFDSRLQLLKKILDALEDEG